MENNNNQPLNTPMDTASSVQNNPAANKRKMILWVVIAVAVIGILIFAVIKLFQADVQTTSRIRDVFIIFMALESLLLGIALTVLIIQLAVLINVLKNEVKPILDTTNETMNNLRGTTTFMSNNIVEPVIKLNEYLAGFRKLLDLVMPVSKSRRATQAKPSDQVKENTDV
jgi:uncharacterized membrane protein YhaH (DUF805 family)